MFKKLGEINPLSAAETLGFLFSFLGFFIGLIYSLLLFFNLNLDIGFNFLYQLIKSLNLEYFSLLLFPLSYLVIGFVLGAVISSLYNLSSKLSNGGIEIELSE